MNKQEPVMTPALSIGTSKKGYTLHRQHGGTEIGDMEVGGTPSASVLWWHF